MPAGSSVRQDPVGLPCLDHEQEAGVPGRPVPLGDVEVAARPLDPAQGIVDGGVDERIGRWSQTADHEVGARG